MLSLRKWLYKPKKDDPALLSRFYHLDEELTLIRGELDRFDFTSDLERYADLAAVVRHFQDRLLSLIFSAIEEAVPEAERASTEFRVKYPDDIQVDGIAAQLWFGAECIAAGSTILNRELDCIEMRPLARTVTNSLEHVRALLRELALRHAPGAYPKRVKAALSVFDHAFAAFELQYISCVAPVKTPRDYDLLQEVAVLFSETVTRAIRKGLLTLDSLEACDPALIVAVPRLAIVYGLVICPSNPINPEIPPLMSELFQPFFCVLRKIRNVLWQLTADDLRHLEEMLCDTSERSTPPPPPPPSANIKHKTTGSRPSRKSKRRSGKRGQSPTFQKRDSDTGPTSSWENTRGLMVSNTGSSQVNSHNNACPSIAERLSCEESARNVVTQSVSGHEDNQVNIGRTPRCPSPVQNIEQTIEQKTSASAADEEVEVSLRMDDADSIRDLRTKSCDRDGRISRSSRSKSRSNGERSKSGPGPRSRSCGREETSIRRGSESGGDRKGGKASGRSSVSRQTESAFVGAATSRRDERKDLSELVSSDEEPEEKAESDRIQKLFICVSAVADQLQSNHASDLRHILKAVYLVHSSADNEVPDNTSRSARKQREVSATDHISAGSRVTDRRQSGGGANPWGRPLWASDAAHPQCGGCGQNFTLLRRRHHCRSCGKIFCGRCSSEAASLPHLGYPDPVRVCDVCVQHSIDDTLGTRLAALSNSSNSESSAITAGSSGEPGPSRR